MEHPMVGVAAILAHLIPIRCWHLSSAHHRGDLNGGSVVTVPERARHLHSCIG
jgi:hypothetical protein